MMPKLSLAKLEREHSQVLRCDKRLNAYCLTTYHYHHLVATLKA